MLLVLSKGYFKDEGLNVIIDQGEGLGVMVMCIMLGIYDVGFGDINVIIQNVVIWFEEILVMVYQMWSVLFFVIFLCKEIGIIMFVDLLGKIFGGVQGMLMMWLVMVFVCKNGIDLVQLQIINFVFNL